LLPFHPKWIEGFTTGEESSAGGITPIFLFPTPHPGHFDIPARCDSERKRLLSKPVYVSSQRVHSTKPAHPGTIGHLDHGKTTLTAAILAVHFRQSIFAMLPTPWA
jgi:hypothetical protein